MPNNQGNQAGGSPPLSSERSGANSASQSGQVPPELLEKVIERVYQMMLADLTVERERSGTIGRAMGERMGGWLCR